MPQVRVRMEAARHGGRRDPLGAATRGPDMALTHDQRLARILEAFAAIVVLGSLRLDERGKSYYYDDVTVKRWILGSGGRAGNCDDCIENSDAGEIEESEAFPADGQFGVVDEPPLHEHCDCTVEYRDTRKRVYV